MPNIDIVLLSIAVILLGDALCSLAVMRRRRTRSLYDASIYEIIHLVLPLWIALSGLLAMGTLLNTFAEKVVLLILTSSILALMWFNILRMIAFISYVCENDDNRLEDGDGEVEEEIVP